jgi:hypothetical protein
VCGGAAASLVRTVVNNQGCYCADPESFGEWVLESDAGKNIGFTRVIARWR